MPTRHYFVEGRVQGVGYRAFACRQGQALGLDGWVRNLADGCVEAVACGDEAALAGFEVWLARGPRCAEVRRVVATASEVTPDSGFVVC